MARGATVHGPVGNVFAASDTLEITRCCSCGVVFAMPERMLDERRRDKANFYCPNGHSLAYSKSTEQKLREQLDRANARETAVRDQLDAAERSRSALRGVITRQQRKAAAGVCPVDDCRRHFDDLEQHMTTVHPAYAKRKP